MSSKSRHAILLARLRDLDLHLKLLELRRDNFPSLFNRFFMFSVFLFILELIRSNAARDWPRFLFAAFVLLLPVIRIIVPWRYRRKISQIKADRQKMSAQLADSLQDQVKFMEQFHKETRSVKQRLERPTYSPLCTLWDQITHSYRSNPKALICPVCGAHNGLHDPDNPPTYNCPNCQTVIGGDD
jgi:hypothetical protein